MWLAKLLEVCMRLVVGLFFWGRKNCWEIFSPEKLTRVVICRGPKSRYLPPGFPFPGSYFQKTGSETGPPSPGFRAPCGRGGSKICKLPGNPTLGRILVMYGAAAEFDPLLKGTLDDSDVNRLRSDVQLDVAPESIIHWLSPAMPLMPKISL